MKILLVHNRYFERGGEDEAVDTEVRLLREHGHKVIFYEKSNEHIKKLSFPKKLFFILFSLNFSKTVYSEIKEIIKRERPDVAHIHNIFFSITPSVYFALKEENIPIIQTFHNYRFFCLKGTFFRKGKICEKCKDKQFFNAVAGKCWRNSFFLSYFLAKILYKSDRFLKSIDSYIALSNFGKDKFIELGIEEHKIYLKPNFLEIQPDNADQDKNYALFIGRLVDYKGIRTVMDAFKISSSFKLKIIGDGPLKNEVRAFASTHKNIEWLGKLERNSTVELIKKSSFLVFPSECYETMGMVVIESFACSKPVLASKLGTIKEFVIDGVNGILFEPGNVNDLAIKAAYLFSHDEERTEMGRNANKFYRERFNKEKNYQDLIGIYKKAMYSLE